jgi:hypothetical protein
MMADKPGMAIPIRFVGPGPLNEELSLGEYLAVHKDVYALLQQTVDFARRAGEIHLQYIQTSDQRIGESLHPIMDGLRSAIQKLDVWMPPSKIEAIDPR